MLALSVPKLFYYRSGSLKRLTARGKKVAARIPELRDRIDSPIWTDGARVELPSAPLAALSEPRPSSCFRGGNVGSAALKTASVAVGDKNRTSADLKHAEMEARPQFSAPNEEIEAKLATALSTIDEELGSAGPKPWRRSRKRGTNSKRRREELGPNGCRREARGRIIVRPRSPLPTRSRDLCQRFERLTLSAVSHDWRSRTRVTFGRLRRIPANSGTGQTSSSLSSSTDAAPQALITPRRKPLKAHSLRQKYAS